MASHRKYYMEDSSIAERLLKVLKRSFKLSIGEPSVFEQHFFDTFDWRIYKSGYLLFCQNKTLKLMRMKDGVGLAKLYWNAPLGENFFASAMKEGALKDILSPISGSRALLPLAGIRMKNRLFTLIDENGNAVAVLKFEEAFYLEWNSEAEESFFSSLDISILSGFKDVSESLDRTVRRLGAVDIERGRNDLWHLLFSMLGRSPDDYSGKQLLAMDPSMTVKAAVSDIIVRMISVMEENRNGIIDDVDNEFLHDFRVALRRMKSAASMLKGVLPSGSLNKFNADFASLRLMTNELRDMDVYLQMQNDYMNMLPGSLSEGLESFFRITRQKREAEASLLSDYLKSRKATKVLEKWKAFFSAALEDKASSDSLFVKDSSSKSISRHYRKLLKESETLDEHSADQDFHRIRIRCKKLRYCLEFFGAFYPAELSDVLRRLKVLQDSLGRLNDCSVHADLTIRLLEKMNHSSPEWVLSAAAAGGLVTGLAAEKERLKSEAVKALSKLTRKKQRKLFQKLFREESPELPVDPSADAELSSLAPS